MLLIYNNAATLQALSEDERNAFMAEIDPMMAELTQSGELIGGDALADPVNTKTVRVRNGVPAVTDGPFLEAKEQFAGYLMIETDHPERAVEIAARWPDAKLWAMEVRPIMDSTGQEM